MVDLSSGSQDGPIEHGFSNSVFIVPAFIVVTLSDLLQGVQEAGAENAGPQLPPNMGEFKMPSLEQMMELLGKMDIPDDEKAKIMEGFTSKGDMLATLAGKGAERIGNAMHQGTPTTSSLGLVMALSVVVLVFVFFGYKLYKSLMDKERKREEKRKLKMQKKKK